MLTAWPHKEEHMKALIILRDNTEKSLKELFTQSHPAMVPICNKPLLEYWVDFSVLNRCGSIRVILESSSKEFDDYFGNGERWGIDISYSEIPLGKGIDEIIRENSEWCSDTPLIIMDGLFFIHYNQSDFKVEWSESSDAGLLLSCNTGSLLMAQNVQGLKNISRAPSGFLFSLSEFEGVDDLLRISMEVLAAEQDHYVLPGYRENNSSMFGKNISLGTGVDIRPPVIIGNDVKIRDNVIIGPRAVIGNNVIVDQDACVKDSVLMPNTYTGQGLQVERKLVNGNRVFSPSLGTHLEVNDDAIFSILPERLPVSIGSIRHRCYRWGKMLLEFMTQTLKLSS